MPEAIENDTTQKPEEKGKDSEKLKRPGLLVYTEDTEKEYIRNLVNRASRIQKNRSGSEKQWLVNTAFLYGRQHFDVEKVPTRSDLVDRIVWELRNIQRRRRDRAKRTVNYILPLWRSLMARLIRLKTRIQVNPDTESTRDRSAARIGQEVLEDHWKNVNKTNPTLSQELAGMMKILMRLFNYLTITGKAYLFPQFNPDALVKAVVQGEVIDAFVGAVETKVYSPFDVFPDPNGQFVILQDTMGVDSIQDQYEVEVEPENIGLTETERELQRLLNGERFDDESSDDSARIYTMIHLPTKKHEHGIFTVFTSQKMLIKPTDIPPEYKNRIPVFGFNFLDFMNGKFPQGMVEQLIPSQEDYNYSVERISSYKKFMAGKLLMPKLCKPETVWDDEVGQIIKYDSNAGTPTYTEGINPPLFFLREFDRIRRDMEDIAATHDVSLSRVPGGVKSGVAIEQLTEADNTQLTPQLIEIEQQLSFYSETVLDIAQHRYTEERIIGISGKNLSIDAQIFKGEQLKGNKQVTISLGSSLPSTRLARKTEILDLRDRELITPEKTIELLEFGDIEGIFHDIDAQAERVEIRELAQGTEVVPAEWENHAKRIKVLTDFMKTEDYQKLSPEIQNNFITHLRWHRIFLQNEMQAAAALSQPPAKPQPAGKSGGN